MIRHTPSLHDVQRLVRARICADCPYRTPGMDNRGGDFARPCEATCGLFTHLPQLRGAARQLDTMVGHRPRVLRRIVPRFAKGHDNRAKTVRRHGHRVIEWLCDELFA